jgi:hypothetical protein
MTAIVVPTFTTQGWVTDLPSKVDSLLAHALVAEDIQTYCYPGEICSITKQLQLTGNKAIPSARMLEDRLGTFFKRHFDSARVSVEVADEDDLSKTAKLRILIEVNDNGVKRVVGKLLESSDGKVKQFIDLNN